MHFRSNLNLEVLVYKRLGEGRDEGTRVQEKNLLEKGQEITRQDLNKGKHVWKVSTPISLQHPDALLSGAGLMKSLQELP